MAQVTVIINGRQYRMGCEDGEEPRVLKLAEELDDLISRLRGAHGEIGDQRLTVMAALTVADELAEQGERLRKLEEELDELKRARAESAERTQETQIAIVRALTTASERIEELTRQLNQTVNSDPGIALG